MGVLLTIEKNTCNIINTDMFMFSSLMEVLANLTQDKIENIL